MDFDNLFVRGQVIKFDNSTTLLLKSIFAGDNSHNVRKCTILFVLSSNI